MKGKVTKGTRRAFPSTGYMCVFSLWGKKIIILDLGKLLYDVILQYKVTKTKLLPIKGNSHCSSESVYKMAVTYLPGLLSTFVVVVILGDSLSLKGPGILCETL